MITTTNDIMNAKQSRAYERVLDVITIGGIDEVKDLNVHGFDDGDDVYVSVEVGIPNDEGTAAILCRRNFAFFIGPRGGLFYYNDSSNRVSLTPYTMDRVRMDW